MYPPLLPSSRDRARFAWDDEAVTRIGALPVDCVPAGAIKTLPPSLPTTLAGVVELAACCRG
jgi:hypothetical protein